MSGKRLSESLPWIALAFGFAPFVAMFVAIAIQARRVVLHRSRPVPVVGAAMSSDPRRVASPSGTGGTALANEMSRYSHGSIDNLYGRERALPDDEPYMRGWFAREHSKAWGNAEVLNGKVHERVGAALALWNEWLLAHGLEEEERLPL